MKNQITYITLKPGDIRKPGDEVFRTAPNGDYDTNGDKYSNPKSGWLPVRLIGHTILPTDLIVSTFRRPV